MTDPDALDGVLTAPDAQTRALFGLLTAIGGLALLVGLVALGQLTCSQAILVAPLGSTLQLFANPLFIPAAGGASVVTAVLTEPAGTPVPDGTVVQFFTALGRIDEQVKFRGYRIEPAIKFWDVQMQYPGGSPVPWGWVYSSASAYRLSIQEIQEII